MMDLTTLLILGLATWRIASLLTKEAGPFHVFMKIRKMTGIIHDADGNVLVIPDQFFAGIFSCVWCSSVWIGLGLVGLWWFFPIQVIYGSAFLAVSAFAISVDRWITR
jgi:hypothetical protein